VKLSPPYFLPSLQIGLFGSITNLLSYPKTRKALFDISIAGPTLGFLSSLALTLYGLTLTTAAAPDVLASFPVLPAGFFSSSLLLDQLIEASLHIKQTAEAAGATLSPTQLVPLHPLVPIGITGLLTNAYNFLPIGRLDGGRVAQAIAGRRTAANIAFFALLGLAASFLSNSSPIILFWSLIVVFLQRGAELPAEDDVTPVATDEEDGRKGPLWLARAAALGLCVVLTAGTIVPVPYDPSLGGGAPSAGVQGPTEGRRDGNIFDSFGGGGGGGGGGGESGGVESMFRRLQNGDTSGTAEI
jgi:Zn-dependent protease